MTDEVNPGHLCLVTAVDVEFKTATGLLSQPVHLAESRFNICQGFFGNRSVTVLQCGMGAHGFAEWLGHHLETNHYETLIVIGLAGGLDPKCKTGDVVVYDLCRDVREQQDAHTSQWEEVFCDNRLSRSLFEAFQTASFRRFRGTGITVSQIVTLAKDKLRLGQRQQALAVDMESFEILRVSAEFGLPATAVRVISDEATHTLPDFNSAADASGKMNPWRLAGAMLRRPMASIRFLVGLKTVLDALRKSLQVVLQV
mgnify:CR=1 FL=1